VTATVSLRSKVAIDHLEIIGNGAVVKDIPLHGERTSATESVKLPVAKSGWYLVRAKSDKAEYPVLDLYPYATTSPIYVVVDGQPIRSEQDAAYFMQWIDRLGTEVKAYRDFNSEAERTHVLQQLGKAWADIVKRNGMVR
jgi:hypothetical protein